MRVTSKVVLGILGAAVLALLLAKANADRHFYDGYDATAPLNARVASSEVREAGTREAVYFDGMAGESIPALLALPKDVKGKVPCVVFLHGIGQKKDFLDEISPIYNQQGFAIASFDQYTRGERRLPENATPWQQLVAFRQRAARTPNDARRLVDYLQTRPEIDGERIYLVGASYGAITGTVAAALDPRFKAVVLVYGGANIRHLMSAREIRGAVDKGPFGWAVADVAIALARYVLAPADPAIYAPRIAPRPVYLQNGTTDGLISDAAAKALQEAVQEPKKIDIYPGDHIGVDEATVWEVLKSGIAWLQAQDAALASAR